jgi:hypothetical protein
MNYGGGMCFITSIGNHDPKKGGHLILWELGLAIEFPSGATAAIPSAVITHSNLPVAKHEERVSFTQYAAGALLRWVDSDGILDSKLDKEGKKRVRKERLDHAKRMVELYTTIDDLIEL